MPIYEYRCGDCGHTLDALQKLSDDPLKDCPECEQPSLKRLMSAPAFRLKGGGWYETDFKSDKEKKRNLAEGGDKGGDKSESKSSTDSAGDKKSEKKETKAKDSGTSAAIA
jgi:putative FmdB family regulatory protein